MNQPRKVETREDGGLQILWDDGHRAVYAATPLRLACKCALCEEEWSGRPLVDPATLPSDLRVAATRPVGRYGLSIAFSDGHGTGIYTFDRLRALCGCDHCAPRPAP